MNYSFKPNFETKLNGESISIGNIPKEDTQAVKAISRGVDKKRFVKNMKKWAKDKRNRRRIVWDPDLIISVEVPGL